ncbi:MAG TPA: nucleotidyltransferase domain-containing protein [Herpetosiphonaceae bacterium]|nr:nucleotidyltransferase domain-containing protein [Herpetosiphonaceae bacterium]
MPPEAYEAYRRIAALAEHERYLGAFVFGSVARGDDTGRSDFDLRVVVDEPNTCRSINHPFVDGVKLDISFESVEQLRAATAQEIARRERIPMLAESTIIFDKTGELGRLKMEALQTRPRPFTPDDHQRMQFLIYHYNDKAERFLHDDPPAALLIMHTGLNDLLQLHYQIHEHWWVSSKRLLQDLRAWDPGLATLVERLVRICEVHAKFAVWSEIVDWILRPMGGRQPIAENNCDCLTCRHDLGMLVDR